MLTENADGQVSLFGQDTSSGKTCRERSAVTWGGTSKQFLPKSSGLPSRTRQRFLCLTRENGEHGTFSWVTGGALPIVCMTPNFGEFRSDADEFRCLLTSEDGQPLGYYLTLNCGEKPRNPIPSKLSEILEANPNTKYRLSAKACSGILNRAERRGKELPPELKAALTAQSASKETELTELTPQDATVEDGAGGGVTPLTQSTGQQSTT